MSGTRESVLLRREYGGKGEEGRKRESKGKGGRIEVIKSAYTTSLTFHNHICTVRVFRFLGIVHGLLFISHPDFEEPL